MGRHGRRRVDPVAGRSLKGPFRPGRVKGDFMATVFQNAAGVVWVGGDGGLNRFGDDGRFSSAAPAGGARPLAR